MPTFQGTTIQKAIEAGLAQLGVARDAVSVEVVQEGKKGLFGLGKKAAIVNLKLNEDGADPAPKKPVKTDPKPDAKHDGKPDTKSRVPKPGKVIEKQIVARREKHDEKVREKAVTTPHRDDQTATALVQSYLEDITSELALDVTITSEQKGDTVWFQMATEKEALLIGKHGKIINAIQYLAQTEFNHYGKSKWTIMLNVGDYRQRREAAVTRLADKSAREVVARGTAVYLDPMPSFERKAIHAKLTDSPYVTTHSEGVDPRRYVVITPKPHR